MPDANPDLCAVEDCRATGKPQGSRMSGPAAHGGSSSWRGLRIQRGISLRRLEMLSGINRGRLSVIERGLSPSPAEAAAILEVYSRTDIRLVLRDLTVTQP